MRRVVLVVGPPGAGKSTWVSGHAGSGVRVVDFDRIAKRLGSPTEHDHPPDIVKAAQAEQIRQEVAVGALTDGSAYVVRTAADPAMRARVAERIGATHVQVIDPGRSVVESRTIGRSDSARAAVADWYAKN